MSANLQGTWPLRRLLLGLFALLGVLDETAAAQAPGFSGETVLEATYNYSISPWWTIQPDFQYIWTPSGEDGSRNAAVLGIRTVITF